jgi:hypothetical protein
VVAGATLVLALPGVAHAQAPTAVPTISPSQAEQSLAAAQEVLDPGQDALDPGQAAAAPADASATLNALAQALPALDGSARARARALLARPTDGSADRYGDGFPKAAPVTYASSEHFCVFFVSSPGYVDAPDLVDANGDETPDYVEAVLAMAERSYAVQVAPGPLAWAPPKPDRSGCEADPSTRADIYLKQLGKSGVFGYESPDPGQGQIRSKYGYLVIDDDYAPAEYGFADPLEAARATVAHEFNHLLQQNYDSFQDVWIFEATAVWAEEQVFPEVNDYLNYVEVFAERPGTPITDADGAKGLKIYGTGVWNHWLSGSGGGFGIDVVRRAWEVSPAIDPPDFAVGAYQRAIRDLGGRGFSREFTEFVAATAEWRTADGAFPDAALYPDVRRKQQLKPGRELEFTLDHTGFRMLDVGARGGGSLVLRAAAEEGLRAGFALVARDGDPVGGEVVVKRRYLDQGGKARLTLDSPGRFERITAVAVNADGRVAGFGGRDWAYRKDGQRFAVGLERGG